MVIATLAAYGFARFGFPGSRVAFLVMLAAIMVPFQVLMVPMYTVLNDLSLTNSLIGVVLVMTTFQLPFATFVVQNSFAAIPDASVVITALPCLIVYVALQRHFVRGIMAGMGR